MLNQNQFDSNPSCECARDLDRCTLQITSRRILHILRRKKPNAQLAGLDEVGDACIRCWLCVNGGHACKQSEQSERNLGNSRHHNGSIVRIFGQRHGPQS